MQPGIDYIGVGTCGFCHDGHGRLFLNLRGQNCRDEWGKWDNCGGEIKFGESPQECLARELREEYGCDALEIRQGGIVNSIRVLDGRQTHWLILSFLVLIDPHKAYNAEPNKHDDAAWFDLDHLPINRHSHFDRDFDSLKLVWNEFYDLPEYQRIKRLPTNKNNSNGLRSSTDKTAAS